MFTSSQALSRLQLSLRGTEAEQEGYLEGSRHIVKVIQAAIWLGLVESHRTDGLQKLHVRRDLVRYHPGCQLVFPPRRLINSAKLLNDLYYQEASR